MKKLFLLIAIVAIVLPSCKKINEELDALGNRINKLEQETIPTIDEQIAAINTTLDNLDAMDKELKGYIDGLTATANDLQEQINATNTKIDEVKGALQGEISAAKAEVLAELEALETELKNELAQINATIETLQAKDEELDKKIADLKTYVNTELKSTKDWVNATFATLEQYNALVSEVATIKEQIKAINQSITDLETRLTTKINEDIANAVATLNADIQQKVSEITTAYTNAIKSAKEEITAAYTAAIQTAINALDASLKSWVGEQLSNYYTIAEIEAKITALQTAITDGDATLQEELSKLKSQLETTATEITAAYKKAIEEAINTNSGVIDTKIANEIASVNQRIDSEVATINAKIVEIESRLDNVEAKIAELLARIQSMSYIPEYADGKATVKFNDVVSHVTLDFEVSPKDAVVELAKVWKDAVSLKAVYTQTRAVSFIDMPITKFEIDETNGVITVTASGENLSEAFFAGTQSASVRLSISDGNNSIVSEYIPLVGKEVTDEIWYTSTDGAVVTPYATDVFGANIVSNTYENGKGVIKFDGDVTSIGEGAFYSCYSLTSVTIPDSVTSIGNAAFYNCELLTSVTIPDSVTSIDVGAFIYCYSLTSVTIGNSVTSIGLQTFSYCTSLTSVTIGNGVTSIGVDAFFNCTSLKSIAIPDSVTSIGAYAFVGCTSLTSVTIPDSVTSIGREAFNNCTSLTSVTIPDSVTSIGESAFYGCSSLTAFYGKFASADNRCLIIDGVLNSFAPAGLTEYTIPDSVTSIGEWAFYDCTSLTSVTIGNSVTSIGELAFYDCISLKSVYISDLLAWCKIDFGNSNANPLCNGAKLYLNGSELTDITIPSDITEIKRVAFRSCSSLTSVTIPDSVTEIGVDAFHNCTSLTNVIIGNGVTSISSNSFRACTSLTSVTIGNGVTSIGGGAFYDCASLKEVYCKVTTPPAIHHSTSFSVFPFNSGIKIYVPRHSYDAYMQYDSSSPGAYEQTNWYVYESYIKPYDFE